MTSINWDTGTLQFYDGMPFGHEVVQAARANHAIRPHAELRIARTALRNLLGSEDDDDRTIVKDINDHLSEELLVVDIDSTGLPKWNSRPLSALSRATYDQLLRFCMWNVDSHADRTAVMAAVTPRLAEDSVRQTEGLIDIDFWPKRARTAIKKSVAAAGNLQPMDSFEAGGTKANGYCISEENRIAISNRYLHQTTTTNPSLPMIQTALHEYMHLAGSKLGGGFMFGIGEPLVQPASGRLLEEAYVGYSVDAAHDKGQSPAESDKESWRSALCTATYSAEREFIGSVALLGAAPVPDKLAGEAYFSELYEPGRARREMQKRLNRSLRDIFPEHEGHALEALCAQYEEAGDVARQALLDTWIKRTYASFGYEVLTDDRAIFQLEPVA